MAGSEPADPGSNPGGAIDSNQGFPRDDLKASIPNEGTRTPKRGENLFKASSRILVGL
tara:strand:+ start:715 stop:888 length:174 start_codon:yes stop_codon:yes gene_type:complete